MLLRRIFVSGLVAGFILLVISYVALQATVLLFPALAEEYFNSMFTLGGDKAYLYFLHPFILAVALSWFWERFKTMFEGSMWFRGLELGFTYALIATLPAMWITYSSLDISLTVVITWFVYGFVQAVIAGITFAKLNP